MRFPLPLVAIACVTAGNAPIPKPDLQQQYQGRYDDIAVSNPNRMEARPLSTFEERDNVEKAHNPHIRVSRLTDYDESAPQQLPSPIIAQSMDEQQKLEQQRRPRRHFPQQAPTKRVHYRQRPQQARTIDETIQTNKPQQQPQQQIAHNQLRVPKINREPKPVEVENEFLVGFNQTLAGQTTVTQQPMLSHINSNISQSDPESYPPKVHPIEEESRGLISFVFSRPSPVPSASPSRPIVSPAGVQYYGNTDAATGPWPECVGWEGHDCKAYIETITTDHPNIMVIGAEAVYDFHRVKVVTSVEGMVIKAPERG
jgi:Potato inhibitor I family